MRERGRLPEPGERAGARFVSRARVAAAHRHRGVAIGAFAAALGVALSTGVARADKPEFRHPFDGQPIEVPEAKTKTPALDRFKQTGVNAYRDDESALADGKALYAQWCQVCHNVDGSGKMCPALIGNDHIYPQTSNDPGMFAILYAGASGAMQSFAGRMSQDEMLRVIAYVRTLGR